MHHLEEFLSAVLARGDRLYLYSRAERRVFSLSEILLTEQERAKRDDPSQDDCLTVRENQILTMVRAGYDYRAIADSLFVTVGTVKKTIHNVYRKIGIRSRLDLFRRQ